MTLFVATITQINQETSRGLVCMIVQRDGACRNPSEWSDLLVAWRRLPNIVLFSNHGSKRFVYGAKLGVNFTENNFYLAVLAS